ncbi:MAG: hypothetical protein A6F72_07200 [Cycloclasticus sp. symbiont of Poecilosclerida sp. N]|nr:MAG: hypothetical protein A6F72_07200 [Cycloclasticus sp. symbiont of Poecilosclerida sp. N]
MKLNGAGHRSDGTFKNIGKLPRISLPGLADSLERFEQWCTPLLGPAELEKTRKNIAYFGRVGGAGEKLHALLTTYNQREDVYSWLDEFWPARYLGRRVPIAINANFCFLFRQRSDKQIEVAAELIAGSLDFRQRLADEVLPEATNRGTPQCMSEYKYLFSTTRIPGIGRDAVRSPYSDEWPGCASARHIIVIFGGQFYRLEVIDKQGQPYNLDELEAALEQIKATTTTPDLNAQAGYLTALPRNDWAEVYPQLAANGDNAQLLDIIEEALFCVCLERESPSGVKAATDEVLQGDAGNRWFDKSISFIVFDNGAAGVNGEHCGLDGTVVVELINAIHDNAVLERLRTARGTTARVADYSTLVFTLDASLKAHISRAREGFTVLAKNTATEYFEFLDFGTDYIKSLKMSPDAFLQMAFQYAHFKAKGLTGATYESVSTRHFDRGRTEAMRVVTPESQAFVACMSDAGMGKSDKVQAFRAAADAHISRAKDCQAGQAPEQHLWQLLLLAEGRTDELNIYSKDLALFESPGWLKMRDDYLSTSSVPSDHVLMFGFGSTSEKCIGHSYLPRRNAIYGFLSTPSSVAEQMQKYSQHLTSTLLELAELLAEE